MARPINVTGLPYRAKIYINNQVLLPASLVRTLGIEGTKYVDVVIKYGDNVIELRGVQLLRTRHTVSRQFTIPREVREEYGIRPLDEVEILEVKPRSAREVIREFRLA
ncbi:AbrB/MazE/SpoVT family DNA-binding domain-containing protein [Caldivirga sp. MU80]|uniref:AbrB/MazE/SpoVT family DNA-binding domain-containing protein n=1 Tax=Caldivirga sp. MU80 TaxID=1650354 RepID=UPI00082C99FB|nr:AbrB/MazE/SpoVT family DNA-binding domain-containing protein [Caldivirga sp. MU80]